MLSNTGLAIIGRGRAGNLDEQVGGCRVQLGRRVVLRRLRLGYEEGRVRGRRGVPYGSGSSAATAATPSENT